VKKYKRSENNAWFKQSLTFRLHCYHRKSSRCMLHSIVGLPVKVARQMILIQLLSNLGRPEWYQSEAATWFSDNCPAWMAASAVLTLTAAAVEPLLDVTWLLTPELGELDVPFAWPLPPELRWETSVTCRQHIKRINQLGCLQNKGATKYCKNSHWHRQVVNVRMKLEYVTIIQSNYNKYKWTLCLVQVGFLNQF